MTNSSRRKKTTTVTNKKRHPQLQIVEAIIRDLIAEYDRDDIKRMWQMIRQEP